MSPEKITTIGLFGFGVVGEGLYKALQDTPSLNTRIKKVCIKDFHKERNAPAGLFTDNRSLLLDDPEIDTIVEVINDADAAFAIVSEAMRNGKSVVSASKKMIAEHFPELLRLREETGQSLLYEAAAGASIPIIRNLEEYYDNDLLHSMRAIVNGSTNFILTRMTEDQLTFDKALTLAQELGFAETDPALDVNGDDAAHKWSFLLTHAYGVIERFDTIVYHGIRNIHDSDTKLAASRNQQIKLVAQARKLTNGKVAAFILPQFITATEPMAFVKNEFNGIEIESQFADKQFFYGKGAGSLPTASAVLSDIAALRYGYKYEYKKMHTPVRAELTNDFFLRVYISFTDWNQVPTEQFEWMEDSSNGSGRSHITGIIHFTYLYNGTWWEEPGISLVLLPDPVLEPAAIYLLKTTNATSL